MTKRSLVVLMAGLVAASLYACGGEEGKDTTDAGQTGTPDASVVVVADASTSSAVDASVKPDAGPGTTADAGVKPYGQFTNISFSSTYVMNYETMLKPDGGEAYIVAHQSQQQTNAPAFTGTYGNNLPIPPNGGAGSVTYALHAPASALAAAHIAVEQTTLTSAGAIIDPMVSLQFATDTFTTGDLEVGLTQNSSGVLALVKNVGKSTQCIAGMAMGTLKVTKAEKLNQVEGGSISFTGSQMPIYHPSETPFGPLTKLLEGFGYQVCPK